MGENSPPSSLLTPLSPSTLPRRDGTKSRTLRPRPVASPLPRLVPVLLSLTTSIAESMLAIGTHTRISPRSSMPSSRTTTESPGITKQQRIDIEKMMSSALQRLDGDLAGKYYPLTGMDEAVRQQLVDDHFLFVSGDRNLTVAGMERDWPEGRGIFHNEKKTFLIWVNEEDQLRIISMQMGGDVRGVFERLAKGIKAVQDSVKKESGKDFCLDEKYGYIHSCPTNLGTGMRASVHVDLPGWAQHGVEKLKARCEELHLQPRGTRGESGGQTGFTYDISNKHRLGYSEVQLVQKMIDGVNKLWEEDKKFQKQYFG